MSDQMLHHTGTIWENVPEQGVGRHTGPGHQFPLNKTLHRKDQVIVLCYSIGESVTFKNPSQENTSQAWDFVVTDYQDPGGFVADVHINTDADIVQQLGNQGTCGALRHRLPDDSPPL